MRSHPISCNIGQLNVIPCKDHLPRRLFFSWSGPLHRLPLGRCRGGRVKSHPCLAPLHRRQPANITSLTWLQYDKLLLLIMFSSIILSHCCFVSGVCFTFKPMTICSCLLDFAFINHVCKYTTWSFSLLNSTHSTQFNIYFYAICSITFWKIF